MKRRIPILMYHSIGSIKRGEGLRNIHTPKWLFTLQLYILKILGYKGMCMTDLLPYLKGKKSGKVFGITFDDGYQNNFSKALPVLLKLKFNATCYIVANNIGGINYWDSNKGASSKQMMNKSEIFKWINSGMEIGSHSLNHIKLSDLNALDAREEIYKSKIYLEKTFNLKINHFCYPYGSYDHSKTTKIASESGYLSSVTVKRGRCSTKENLYTLPRVLMTHRTYPIRLLLKIFTDYEDRRGE